MDLISLIIIITIISKVVKAAKGTEEKNKKQPNIQKPNTYSAPTYQQNRRSNTSADNSKWQQLAKENIEKAKLRAEGKISEVEKVIGKNEVTEALSKQIQCVKAAPTDIREENFEARSQIHASRQEARNTTILQRAKNNANEDKVDVTLQTMEAEHNHSERVAPAEHHHPEDILTENALGKVEDLMIKGYDGNLCFERDFVGEAMDMVNRFTWGGTTVHES